MLSGRSAQEKADKRAAKTQSLYVATPSSLSALPPHLQQFQSGQPAFNTLNTNHSNNSNIDHTATTPKSPRKARPFSMMFMHPQEELTRQQQHQQLPRQDFQPQQQQQLPLHQTALNESDEDATGDGTSLSSTVIEYGESDLKDADSDTRMLIAHLSDLDVRKRDSVQMSCALLHSY